ncbi:MULTISPECIES: ROK family transcriptional regulator [unclassified Streptomyces]|uniref:ROK family transcriptional regulator n=1 Tax=unclassified Streptomyces TaxID=2593676 RepID=UPI000DB9E11F|nr:MULTISPECIES: ROK family transcriptional regulator [unclassified Streptomyces]MYT74663.1 ROK family protein [Streptomyces sp. SID8367]RAJ91647.1 putative NBD/HSP70 family sugar kinase [Streptomyces sp. PsTaAH-137]
MLSGMHEHDGPLTRLRRSHEHSVLDLLRKHGPLSRAELGTRSGLSRTTLYDIVAGLVGSGAVVASTPHVEVRKRGRPVEKLSLNPAAGEAVGIDFARRAVHVAAVNFAHEVIGSASEPHTADLSWPERVDIAERLLGTLATVPSDDPDRSGSAVHLDALSAIGVGVVGPITDPGSERAHAQGIDGLPDLLRKRFGVSVLLDNNTRLAALAEAVWGAAADSSDVLYLRLSHGVGGGLVVGGALHRGRYGLSGEFGHVVVDPVGRQCECGGTGCLETRAALDAVLNRYREAGGRAGDLAGFLAAAAVGEPPALQVLERVGHDVGSVLAAVCHAVGPGVIVVGGELAEAGPALLEPVERSLRQHLMPMARHHVDVRRATLGEAGSALGGIALVLHESPLLSHYPRPVSEENA